MAQASVFMATLWALFQRFGTMFISFSANIVLARLLTPDDFGTIGMLLIFIAIANTFVDGGLGAALIQRKDLTQLDKSTVFYFNLALSVVLYGILFAVAPGVANFYNTPILSELLRAQGLVLIVQAFCIVQTALLSKAMDFKRISVGNLIGNLVGAIVGIAFAYMGFGVWSLVAKTLTTTFVTTLILWIVGGWFPSFSFSIVSLKNLFGFGGFVLLSSLMMTISNNIQTAILAKMFKTDIVGNYTQARTLRNVASESMSSVVGQVLYPDFSKNQDDNDILERKLSLSLALLSFFSIPLMCLCIINADFLIYTLYGTKWDVAIPYFQILCIGGFFIPLQDVNISVIKAKGKGKILFLCNFFKTCFLCVTIIVGGLLWGIYGFIWAMVLYVFIAALTFNILSSYYLKISFFKQVKDVLINLAIFVTPLFVIFFLKEYLDNFSSFVQVLLSSSIYFVLSFSFAFVIKPNAFVYLKSKLMK